MSGLLVIAIGIVLLLGAALVAFQIALALGAPWGAAAYGGQRNGRLPTACRVVSAVAAPVWVLVVLTLLRRAGLEDWTPVPDDWLPATAWVLVGLFGVALVLNTITRSRIERAIWAPACAALLAATIVIALR